MAKTITGNDGNITSINGNPYPPVVEEVELKDLPEKVRSLKGKRIFWSIYRPETRIVPEPFGPRRGRVLRKVRSYHYRFLNPSQSKQNLDLATINFLVIVFAFHPLRRYKSALTTYKQHIIDYLCALYSIERFNLADLTEEIQFGIENEIDYEDDVVKRNNGLEENDPNSEVMEEFLSVKDADDENRSTDDLSYENKILGKIIDGLKEEVLVHRFGFDPELVPKTTEWWHSAYWNFLHLASLHNGQRAHETELFLMVIANLRTIIPCGICASNYEKMDPLLNLCTPVFATLDSATMIFELHNRVNQHKEQKSPLFKHVDFMKRYNVKALSFEELLLNYEVEY